MQKPKNKVALVAGLALVVLSVEVCEDWYQEDFYHESTGAKDHQVCRKCLLYSTSAVL